MTEEISSFLQWETLHCEIFLSARVCVCVCGLWTVARNKCLSAAILHTNTYSPMVEFDGLAHTHTRHSPNPSQNQIFIYRL